MIGHLPKQLNINGTERAIRSDFRVALLIFQAYNEPDYTKFEKESIMFECLYEDYECIPIGDHQEALNQAKWYLDGGGIEEVKDTKHQKAKKIIDWEQDEQIIFSAVNKVAGCETRAVDYLHWWTFLGFFNEIGEGLLSTVINIRQKKNNKVKLEKHEQEFYKKNKTLIDLKEILPKEEAEERERLNRILNS